MGVPDAVANELRGIPYKEEEKMKKEVELAEQHWGYIDGLLQRSRLPESELELVKYAYTTAFIHGFRHGVEECGGDHEGIGQ